MRSIGQWASGPESWSPNGNPPRQKKKKKELMSKFEIWRSVWCNQTSYEGTYPTRPLEKWLSLRQVILRSYLFSPRPQLTHELINVINEKWFQGIADANAIHESMPRPKYLAPSACLRRPLLRGGGGSRNTNFWVRRQNIYFLTVTNDTSYPRIVTMERFLIRIRSMGLCFGELIYFYFYFLLCKPGT